MVPRGRWGHRTRRTLPILRCRLLFLDGGPASGLFKEAYDRMIRTCWDAKLEPGASLRTIPQSMEDSRTDPKFASGLVEARLLWGSQPLFENLQKTFRREIIRKRTRQFIDECVRCRESEWKDGRAVQELEPDVKNSSGGLRDLHLIRWVGSPCLVSPTSILSGFREHSIRMKPLLLSRPGSSDVAAHQSALSQRAG